MPRTRPLEWRYLDYEDISEASRVLSIWIPLVRPVEATVDWYPWYARYQQGSQALSPALRRQVRASQRVHLTAADPWWEPLLRWIVEFGPESVAVTIVGERGLLTIDDASVVLLRLGAGSPAELIARANEDFPEAVQISWRRRAGSAVRAATSELVRWVRGR